MIISLLITLVEKKNIYIYIFTKKEEIKDKEVCLIELIGI